jgi:hypothetical protein
MDGWMERTDADYLITFMLFFPLFYSSCTASQPVSARGGGAGVGTFYLPQAFGFYMWNQMKMQMQIQKKKKRAKA